MTQPITDEQLSDWEKDAKGSRRFMVLGAQASSVYTTPKRVADDANRTLALIAEVRRLREPSGMSAAELVLRIDGALAAHKNSGINDAEARGLLLEVFRLAMRS